MSCTEPNTTKCEPTRSLAVTLAVEGHQRIEHARRAGDLRASSCAQSNFAAPCAPLRPGKMVGDVRLIVAQHVDAEHAVLEHRVGDRLK
jgi:hypothetical protein